MRTTCLFSAKASAVTKEYEDVLKQTRFPHRKPSVSGIHRLPEVSTWTRPQMQSFHEFFSVDLNTLWNK